MQTWLVLMRDPIRSARDMGVGSFLSMQLMLGGGVVAAFAHGPLAFIVLVAALSHYNLGALDFILALTGYIVAMLAALTACALSNTLSHARAAFTMPFYWPLASIAAWRAVYELLTKPHHWSKTRHGVSPRPFESTARVMLNQRSDDNRLPMLSTSSSF
jgi:glycosyltransferase XagB